MQEPMRLLSLVFRLERSKLEALKDLARSTRKATRGSSISSGATASLRFNDLRLVEIS